MKKVYISITDETSSWLDELRKLPGVEYLNDPAVKDFIKDDEDQLLRQNADYVVYVITPRIEDYDVISQLVDDSNKLTERTLFLYLESDGEKSFNPHQIKSLNAIGEMVNINQSKWCRTTEELAEHLSQDLREAVNTTFEWQKSTQHKEKTPEVFLGGTVNNSSWRDELIPKLEVDFFNPVVKEWNEEARLLEIKKREDCDYNLYVITPLLMGYYSLAEVVDDSYKKPGHTIYCFLTQDEKASPEGPEKLDFNANQIRSLRNIGRIVDDNGGIWCKTIEEVITFLNNVHKVAYYQTYATLLEQAVFWNRNERDARNLLQGFDLVDAKRWVQGTNFGDLIPPTQLIKTYYNQSVKEEQYASLDSVFISYSREASEVYVRRLYSTLMQKKVNVWFDRERIRAGQDFREEIRVGIERAGNFIYVISPQSIESQYCQEELDTAKKYNKRIIGILHKSLGESVVDKRIEFSHREEFNQKKIDDPVEEDRILNKVLRTVKEGADAVIVHTNVLNAALSWERAGKKKQLLLQGEEQIKAHEWLKASGPETDPNSVAALPTSLHCEFICESKKHADNSFVDVWLSTHALDDLAQVMIGTMHKFGQTIAWRELESDEELELHIIKATRFLFVIDPHTIKNSKCLFELKLALEHNIPVFPILVENVDTDHIPDFGVSTKSADISDWASVSDFQKVFQDYFSRKIFNNDKIAYHIPLKYIRHKNFRRSKVDDELPFLIRGQALEDYQVWYETNKDNAYLKQSSIGDYLDACNQVKELPNSEIFIAYEPEMRHFVFRLNEQLNEEGKVTWNDHTDKRTSAGSEEFSTNGIQFSENIVVIGSPNYFQSRETEFEREAIETSGKRIIIIQLDPDTEIPAGFSKDHIIPFDHDVELVCNRLLKELNTDQAYVRKFNQMSMEAHGWVREGKNKAKLLRGDALVSALLWLNESKGKSPQPTDNQKDFINKSQDEEKKRKRKDKWLFWLLVLITLLAVVATIFSLIQQHKAVSAQEVAEQQEKKAKSNQEKAEKNAETARIAQAQANRARENAIDAKKEADENAARAEQEGERARLAAEEAKKQRFTAETNAKEAERNLKSLIRQREITDSAQQRNIIQNRVQTAIEMAISSEKLASVGADTLARQMVIAAYDTLQNYGDSTTHMTLLMAMIKVVEGGQQHHEFLDGRALTNFRVLGDQVFALSKNGSLIVKDQASSTTYTIDQPYLENSTAFDYDGKTLVVGNIYGQLKVISLPNTASESDAEATLLSTKQVHRINMAVSNVVNLEHADSSIWVSTGFDGKVFILYKNNKHELIPVSDALDLGTRQRISIDVNKTRKRMVLGTAKQGLYVLGYDDLKTWTFKFFNQPLRGNANTVSAVKLTPDDGSVVLGFSNGSVSLLNLSSGDMTPFTYIRAHAQAISAIDANDNKLIVGSRDGKITFVEWATSDFSKNPQKSLIYNEHPPGAEIQAVGLNVKDHSVYSMDKTSLRKWFTEKDQLYDLLTQSKNN